MKSFQAGQAKLCQAVASRAQNSTFHVENNGNLFLERGRISGLIEKQTNVNTCTIKHVNNTPKLSGGNRTGKMNI